MTAVSRVAPRVLQSIQATIGIVVIGVAANLRLAAITGVAATAVWGTRVRYSALAAIALVALVGCLSIVGAGR
jgi:hypothetical protein